MVAVGDRSRPGWKDVADLLWGAFRLHMRRLVAPDDGSVMAIVSLLGPIAMLAGAMLSLHELAWWVKVGTVPPYEQIPDTPVWFVWLAVAVLAVLRKQRAAAVGAWVGTAGLVWLTMQPYMQWRWTTVEAGWVLLGAITAVALTFSPGPARGRERAGRAPVVVMAVAVGVYVTFGVLAYGERPVNWVGLVVFVAGVLVAAGHTTSAGRKAGLVLLVPVMTALLAQLVFSFDRFRPNETVGALIFFGVPVVVVLAIGLVPRWFRRSGQPVR